MGLFTKNEKVAKTSLITNVWERIVGAKDELAKSIKSEEIASRLAIKTAKADCVKFKNDIIELVKQTNLLKCQIKDNVEDIAKFTGQAEAAAAKGIRTDVEILLTNVEIAKTDNEYIQKEIDKNEALAAVLNGKLTKFKSKISMASVKHTQNVAKLSGLKLRKKLGNSMSLDSTALNDVIGLADEVREEEAECDAIDEIEGENFDEKYSENEIDVSAAVEAMMKGN